MKSKSDENHCSIIKLKLNGRAVVRLSTNLAIKLDKVIESELITGPTKADFS